MAVYNFTGEPIPLTNNPNIAIAVSDTMSLLIQTTNARMFGSDGDIANAIEAFVSLAVGFFKDDDNACAIIAPPRHACGVVEKALFEQGITPMYWILGMDRLFRLYQPPLEFEEAEAESR